MRTFGQIGRDVGDLVACGLGEILRLGNVVSAMMYDVPLELESLTPYAIVVLELAGPSAAHRRRSPCPFQHQEQSGVFFSQLLASSVPSLTLMAMPCEHRRSPSAMAAPLPSCSTA